MATMSRTLVNGEYIWRPKALSPLTPLMAILTRSGACEVQQCKFCCVGETPLPRMPRGRFEVLGQNICLRVVTRVFESTSWASWAAKNPL